MNKKTGPADKRRLPTRSSSESEVWRLDRDLAELEVSRLKAQVDLRNPARGLSELRWDGIGLEGSILGVAATDGSHGADATASDAFARGVDLVATYGGTGERPFSWEIYWRAMPPKRGAVVIDMILSLQTPRLESFPRVVTESRLSSDEIWMVPSQAAEPTLLADCKEPLKPQRYEQPHCVVTRAAGEAWSYAEMTHPDDLGDWQIACPTKQQCLIQRELGGAFMEKGVIRRMRVRAAFLPREEDLKLAAHCLAELAADAPPLTV